MIKLKDIWKNRELILEGIKNNIFPREEVEVVATNRLSICRDCEYNSSVAKLRGYKTHRIDEHCTHCSCPLATKTRALHAQCPIDKWGAILTPEEQTELNTIKKSTNDNKEHNSKTAL